ncbi:MAG: hypothetical protein GY870_10400, partial [archaeon]|nr:hypothetical protein [archaeon]
MTSENIEITIKNACIYDYKNKINGDKKDILISGGKIVEKLNNQQNSLVIDGNEQIVFPGGIDLHTHFFAPETNFIRAKALNEQNMTSLPIYNEIQNSYLNHGFTFLSEMDVPMTQAKLTQINMNEVPLIDHALIMDFGSNWTFASDFQEKNNQNNIACIISKLLADLKGYGISINNPYH